MNDSSVEISKKSDAERLQIRKERLALLRQLSRFQQDREISRGDVVVLVMDPARVGEIVGIVGDQVRVYSVRDFKGCESNWVIVVAPEQTTPLCGVTVESTAAQQQRQQEKLGSDPN